METKNSHTLFILLVVTVMSLGGVLFGFNIGVISSTLPYLIQCWNGLSPSQLAWITISPMLGAIIGVLTFGRITDIYGRKNILILSSILFAIGAVLSGASSTSAFLTASRVITGIAIGVSSFAIPLYLSETSPVKIRGAMVLSFYVMICFGMLLSYFTNQAFANEMNPFSWRWMFYIGVVPAILMFIGMLFLPETPRFLFYIGEFDEGKGVLQNLESNKNIDYTLKKMKSDFNIKDSSSIELRFLLRKPLVIALVIMFVQQFTGINFIFFYSSTLLALTGFTGSFAAILFIGVITILAVLLSLSLVDKIGRKRLLFIGLAGMSILLTVLGLLFNFQAALINSLHWLIGIIGLLYVIFFALGIGSLSWLLISELFPFRMRALGMSLGALFFWVFYGFATLVFLKSEMDFGIFTIEVAKISTISLYLNAILALWAIFWIKKNIPETAGVSLEKIEESCIEDKNTCEL